MGGFVSAGLEKIGNWLADKGTSSVMKAEESKGGRGLLSLAGNQEWEMNLNPEGKAINSMLSDYKRIKTASLGEMTNHIKTIKDFHQSNDVVRNGHDLATGPIKDLTKYAGVNHPVNKAIGALGKKDPSNLGLTLPEMSKKAESVAKLDATAATFGAKMQNLTPLVASMLEHKDPRVQLNGQRVLDIVSSQLHDTRTNSMKNLESGVKTDVSNSLKKVNTLRERAAPGSAKVPLPNTEPTSTTPTEAERTANHILRVVQIPFVAIPHIGQLFHIPASAPWTAIGKALIGMDKQEMTKTIEASHILAHTQWDVIHSDLAARTGNVAKWTNSPTAASIIAKSIHQPGFNWLRTRQLSLAGGVGFHSAIMWAHNFAATGDKKALAELLEMGIDPAEVKKQGGILDEHQLAKGVYHFTNNRFFFDRSIDNSLWQNKNFFTRSAFMYHSFISSETAYLRRELVKNLKAGDVKSLAQFVGTLGIAFPAVAPMLKSAELLFRSGSPQQATDSAKKDYNSLLMKNGIVDAGETYLDMIAHLGAMGAAYNYTNAIKSHRLANAVMGPMIGMGITDIEDAGAALMGKSSKPLGRDATQMLPVIGKPLSHKLFPTNKEEHPTLRHRSRPNRRRR